MIRDSIAKIASGAKPGKGKELEIGGLPK